MKGIFVIPLLCLLLAEIYNVQAQAQQAMTIAEATAFCEAAVPQHCVSNTCPRFCKTMRTKRNKETCKAQCTADLRCKLRPAAGTDDPKNQILDAQNRDQLWACIAEKRDPNNSITGRRETPWKQLETTSYKRATGSGFISNPDS